MPPGRVTYRNDYAPYGKRSETQVSGSVPGNPKGYINQRNDPSTGLLYLNARYLDPDLGLFTQPDTLDPLLLGVGTNRYAYAGNNPIAHKDPGGKQADIAMGNAIAEVFGELFGDNDKEHYREQYLDRQDMVVLSNRYTVEIGINLAADFTPVFGDAKAFIEAEDVYDYVFAGIGLVPGVGDLAGKIGKVGKYEVGTYRNLKLRSAIGDKLDVHHVAQQNPAGQVINNYDPNTAPSIAVPAREHRRISTIRGGYNGTARDLLAKDIRDLRSNTNAPNRSLKELIDLNKKSYPDAFKK
jgi:RHS repeat-associated protein